MSNEYRLDFRAAQMSQLNHAIRMAQQHLGAAKAQIACGHAEVTVMPARRLDGAPVQATHLKGDMSAVEHARRQDTLEVRNSHGLKTRLASAGPNLSAAGLGDWKDVPASFEVGDQATKETKGLRRLAELECAGLEGARIAIFEHTDHHGAKTLHFGVDAELQNDKGEWLSPDAKAAFDKFQASLAVAQDVALEVALAGNAGPHEHQSAVDAALELAGLEPVEQELLPEKRTHTVFSNTATSTGKNNKAGG